MTEETTLFGEDRQARMMRPERVAALERLGLMHDDVSERFTSVIKSVQALTGAPIVLFNVLNATNQRTVATTTHELMYEVCTLEDSYCRWTVADDTTIAITDSLLDERVIDSKYSGSDIRAYLGVPVHSEGEVIGSLCAIDPEPREWLISDEVTLRSFARLIEDSLALHAEKPGA